ncbi:MAG: ABC transporter permease [Bacillota bacterium]|jgi:osmoprotectant transport system permease protein
MTPMQKRKTGWSAIILPLILIAAGIGYTYYAVEYPQDNIVRRFLSYQIVLHKLWQHIYIILISGGLAIATSVPLGIILTRAKFKKYAPALVNVVNVGQTIPSLAVIALFVGILGIGSKTAIFALWLYSLLPILNNTLAGILGVDKSIIEAARGMGITPKRILTKIELPLAFPVIMAGIRTAITINIGTAILAAFVGAGGLGDLIIAGNNISRWQIVILGAGWPCLMAILADHVLGLVENYAYNSQI